MFFTWNQSKDELNTFLQTISEQHRHHLHLKTYADTCVQFLNISIENDHGQLHTSVFKDRSRSQQYLLPYVQGHPKLKHRLWLRSCLVRAICCCSKVIDFQREQNYLEITCLAHGYSRDFIEIQFKHFYQCFQSEEIIRFDLNQSVYDQIRRRVFHFMTEQRQIEEQNHTLADHNRLISFDYLYDYGPYHQFKMKFDEHWLTYIKEDPQLLNKQDMKIFLNTKHIYSLNTLFSSY